MLKLLNQVSFAGWKSRREDTRVGGASLESRHALWDLRGTALLPHSARTAGPSSPAWLGRNHEGFVFIKLRIFFTFAFFFFLTQGYIHGICETNWKQNFWYLIQSAFPHMLASSEGLELSPACGQCKLQLHFKIRTKYGVLIGSVSTRHNWVHYLCTHLFKTVP